MAEKRHMSRPKGKKKKGHQLKVLHFGDYVPKESFSNNNDILLILESAVTISEEILLGNENLRTDYEARVNKITKNIVKVVEYQRMNNRICNPEDLENEGIKDIHSILFYCVLKNNGIQCDEADQYYEVLEGFFPELDWELYLAVIVACDWSEMLAKCVSQLPDAAAMVIIKLLITTISDRKYGKEFILHHGILQAITIKLFTTNNTSEPIKRMMFRFPFVVAESTAVGTEISAAGNDLNGNTDNTSFLKVLNHVLEIMNRKSNDGRLAVVLLNGLITAFDLFAKDERLDPKTLINLEQYSLFMEQYFQLEDVLNFLKAEIESFELLKFIRAISMEEKCHWLCGYLLILVHDGWQQVKGLATLHCDSKTFCTLDKLVETLFSHHPLKTKEPVKEEYITLLISLLKNDLDGKMTAFDFFMEDVSYLKRADVQSCIANHTYMLSSKERYRKLMTVAFTSSGPEKKQLLKIFQDWYRGVSPELQQELLQLCLSEFGLSSFVKSPNFDADVNEFFKTVIDLDKVMFFLPQFCMQSPQEVLQQIVTKVIEDGTTSLILVQALKSVSCVCSYQRTPACPPLLIEVLKPRLVDRSLSPVEKKNACLLIDKIMTVFPSDSAFSRYHFVMRCILPNFTFQTKLETMEFFMNLLNLILLDSLSTDYVSWLTEIRPVPLMMLMSSMMNYCFYHKNIEFKIDVANVLNHLLKLHKKFNVFEKLQAEDCQKQLKAHLQKLSPIVKFYVLDFIQEPDIDVLSLGLDHLLIWCILRENDLSQIDDCIIQRLQTTDRLSLVKALSQDLVYLTVDEVTILCNLLTKLHWSSSDKSELVEAGEKGPSGDHLDIFPLIELLVDAFIVLQKDNATLHLGTAIGTFYNVVLSYSKNVCSSLTTFKKVFLQICKLATKLSTNVDVICSLLTKFLMEMEEITADEDFEAFKKEILTDVDGLPECSMKYTLLRHFKIVE